MYKFLTCLFLVSLTLSCNTNSPDSPVAQNTGLLFSIEERNVELNDGLYIEKPDSNIHFDYSSDNKMYVDMTNFKYAYVYIKNGDSLFFTVSALNKEMDWEFIKKEDVNDSTIVQINLVPEPMSFTFGIDYPQTIIRYDYIGKSKKSFLAGERTSCIENCRNIWLHPPRQFLFRILELNPFPYIQAPYEIGNKWNGKLAIGKHWADKRWKLWDGSITNKYAYEIVDIVNYKTEIGTLYNCFVIDAKAESSLGTTALKSWFHPDEGFLKLHYTNIDSSELVFEKVWN